MAHRGQNRANNNRRNGFTLIELLVVIAIIAILAAILFPVFARARENARRSSCQSNLKQVALGILQYSQDYDEKLPKVWGNTTAPSPNEPYGWADALQPYLKSTQIFQCPSETLAPTANIDATRFPGAIAPTYSQYTDYWYNATISGQSQAVITAVALTVMNGDGNGAAPTSSTGAGRSSYNYNGCQTNGNSCATEGIPAGPIRAMTYGAGRHLDGANYSFADGHVKWLKGSQVTTGTVLNGSAAVLNNLATAADGKPYLGIN